MLIVSTFQVFLYKQIQKLFDVTLIKWSFLGYVTFNLIIHEYFNDIFVKCQPLDLKC